MFFMAILKVARLGHPVIRQAAKPVAGEAIGSAEVQRLIDDMIETMHEYDGVGLAAPQVHVSQQLVVIQVDHNPRYPQAPSIPLTVLINPEIVSHSQETVEDWEGCLSVGDLRGQVPRWQRVEVKAFDRQGHPIQFAANDFFARVIQHECDHLQGQVFLDRMSELTTLTHLAEFARYWAK